MKIGNELYPPQTETQPTRLPPSTLVETWIPDEQPCQAILILILPGSSWIPDRPCLVRRGRAMVRSSAKCICPLLPFGLKGLDLHVKRLDVIAGFIDRRPETVPVSLPSSDVGLLPGSSTHLDLDLLARLALVAHSIRRHDQFHAACFTLPVLLVAVLPEMSPLPIATGEQVLVEETHVERIYRPRPSLG